MAIAFIASTDIVLGDATHTISISVGDCVVVFAGAAAAGATITSVTDDGGNTYTKRVTAESGTDNFAEVWTTIATAAATAVTVDVFTAGINSCVATYSGVDSIGTTGTNTATSATPTITVSIGAGSFLVGATGHGNRAVTANVGNLREGGSAVRTSAADNVNGGGSPANVTLTVTLDSSQSAWEYAAVELVPPSTGQPMAKRWGGVVHAGIAGQRGKNVMGW